MSVRGCVHHVTVSPWHSCKSVVPSVPCLQTLICVCCGLPGLWYAASVLVDSPFSLIHISSKRPKHRSHNEYSMNKDRPTADGMALMGRVRQNMHNK